MGVGKGIMLTTLQKMVTHGKAGEKRNTAVCPCPGVPEVRDQSGVSEGGAEGTQAHGNSA